MQRRKMPAQFAVQGRNKNDKSSIEAGFLRYRHCDGLRIRYFGQSRSPAASQGLNRASAALKIPFVLCSIGELEKNWPR
jgi:hypothetical protein